MPPYTRGDILKANLTSGLPTRTLTWRDYEGASIQPCNEYYLPGNSALPLVLPWIYDYSGDLLSGSKIHRTKKFPEDLSLHDEILAFIEYMTPTMQEVEVRKNLVDRFISLLASFDVPASPPEPYGSYVTGLFLATSDVDMFITPHKNNSQRDVLSQVQRCLMRMPSPQFHRKIVDILRASVPLLTITDQKTGLAIDLSAEPSHSIASTQAVVDWLSQDPEGDDKIIKMLIIIVKTFLAIRRCGTTYTGGVNSYLVVWLVISWVKQELPKLRKIGAVHIDSDRQPVWNVDEQRRGNSGRPNIDQGKVLVAFFKFYGEEFDYKKTRIIIKPQPKYTAKPPDQDQPFLLSLIDPADSSIDLGRKGYAIKHVAASFREACQELTKLESERLAGGPVGEQGILGQVLGGDFMKNLRERMNIAE